MKYRLTQTIALSFLSIIVSFPITAQSVLEPVVDRRVETLSIIFRLAECDEYNGQFLEKYVRDIDAHFLPYKNHPVVLFTQKIRKTNGVGFDAVMSMAVHLGSAPEFLPLVPFSNSVPDQRWGKRNSEKFLSLLRKFYVEAQCDKFFNAHREYFSIVEKNFKSSMIRGVDQNWYTEFYGENPSGNFNLMIGLGNGGNNYGSKVVYRDGREDLYSIISNALPDSSGFATFKPENIQSTIIHEYNHSYVNHLVYAESGLFRPQINKVFGSVKQKMTRMHYGSWEIMVNESLVRAGEIQYDKMHGAGNEEIVKRIRNEQARGFVWMDKLDSLLEKYKASRNQYPTFKSFLPEIAKFYKALALQSDELVNEFEKSCARVVRIDPLTEGTEVESGISELSIQFDKPMASAISINLGEKGIEHFPFVRAKDSVKWSEDKKTLTLKVQLKPNWDYEFVLTSLSFKTQDGYPFKERFVNFKTKQ